MSRLPVGQRLGLIKLSTMRKAKESYWLAVLKVEGGEVGTEGYSAGNFKSTSRNFLAVRAHLSVVFEDRN